jgi:D-alanyl-D-alanine carboxypeptidase
MFWDNENIWNDLMENRQRTWEPERILKYIGEAYFDPGEGWHYSNTNYLLMAMIIEIATGSNFSVQLKKYFWDPFGFKNVYLSQQDSLPGSLAHVYGDNLYYGDKESDVTFMPRNSHESITFGSSGIFTTAEELAKWSHLLFGGEVLKKESLDEMFEFIEFSTISNMEGYGLGVQLYDKSFCYGKNAVGHGGANIGTITYMVYLPDYKSTIVVMINSFPNYGADVITKGLIKAVLMEKNALGIIPYFKFFPTGFLIIFFAVIFIAIIFFSRKKMKAEIK